MSLPVKEFKMLTLVAVVIESKKVKLQGTHFMPQVGEDVIRKHKQTCEV